MQQDPRLIAQPLLSAASYGIFAVNGKEAPAMQLVPFITDKTLSAIFIILPMPLKDTPCSCSLLVDTRDKNLPRIMSVHINGTATILPDDAGKDFILSSIKAEHPDLNSFLSEESQLVKIEISNIALTNTECLQQML